MPLRPFIFLGVGFDPFFETALVTVTQSLAPDNAATFNSPIPVYPAIKTGDSTKRLHPPSAFAPLDTGKNLRQFGVAFEFLWGHGWRGFGVFDVTFDDFE